MNICKKLFVLTALITLFNSCSTGTVAINSIPSGAKVSVIDKSGNVDEIGSTPQNFEMAEFFSGGEQYKEVVISKDKHLSERVLIPRPSNSGMKYKISWKLLKLDNMEEKFVKKDQEKLAGAIASAYSYINQKEYLRAESILNEALNTFTSVSVLYDLMGNLQYIKRDYRKAYSYYKQSALHNPNNSETTKMIEKLRGMYE